MAADKNTTRIIDLKIKGDEALGTINKLTKELEIQKNKLKELNAESKAGNVLSKEQKEDMLLASAASKQLQKEINTQTTVLKNNVAESRAVSGSLQEMRAQHANMTIASEKLSETQRNKLLPQMKELKTRIQEADKAGGNFTSSIGNYSDALTGLPGVFGQMADQGQAVLVKLRNTFDSVRGATMMYSDSVAAKATAQAEAVVTDQAAVVAETELAAAQVTGTATAEMQTTAELARATATDAATVATDIGSASLKLFKMALIGTGIGAIVVLLGSLITYFKQTHEGEETLEKITNVLGATFKMLTGYLAKGVQGVRDFFDGIKSFPDLLSKVGAAIKENLINRLESFSVMGKGIVKILSGDLKGGFKDLANGAAQGLLGVEKVFDKVGAMAKQVGKDIKTAASEAARITEMQQALDKFQSKAIETIATLEKKKEEFTLLLGKAGQSATTKEREAAMDNLIKTEDALMKIKLDIARKTTAIKKAQLDLEQKQSGDAMLETMTAYRQAKADEIKLDGEYSILRKSVDTKRAKLYLQILQEEVSAEQTTYDQVKAISMQKYNDAKTSLTDRLSMLETMKQAEDANFKSQTDSFDDYAKKKIDYNKLMGISDGAALSQEMQNIGLSKLAQAELLKILNARKTELLALNQEDIKLKADQANRLIADLQNQLKLEDLKNKQLNAGKVISHEQELKQMSDAYTSESAQLKLQYDNGLIEEDAFNKKKALLDQQFKTDKAVSNAAFDETEKQNKANQLSDELEIMAGNFEAEAEIRKQQLEAQMAEELRVKGLTEEQKAAIQAKYNKLAKDVDNTALNARLDQAKAIIDGIANLFGAQTVVAKMAASASIAIDTYKGASAAISSMAGAGPVGWAAGAIEAGVIIAAGVANTAKVWKTKSGLPGDGGSGGGGGTSISASPAVMPSTPAQPNYTTTTLNLGNSDTGSRSGQSNQSDAIKSAIKEAYASMPAPQVKVIDIQSATVQANNIKNVSVI